VSGLRGRAYPWSDPDPDRRNAVLLVGAIGIVVVLALALIAYGYYDDRIAPQHATVLEVGGRKFNFDYLERRAEARFTLGELPKSNLQQSVAETLALVEREEITRQAARKNGVTVTEDEMDRLLHTKLRVPFDVGRDELAPHYRTELVRLDLSQSEYRDIMLAELLEARFRKNLEEQAPADSDYVNLGVIRTRLQAEAQGAQERLDRGEAFSSVAAAVSIDSTKSSGGDRGWTPRGALPPKIQEIAFAGLGRSDVFEAEDGTFYILERRGIDHRTVDETGRNQLVDYNFQALLKETSDDSGGSNFNLTTGQLQKIVLKLSRLAAQQNPSGA
jgi:hypothetical protein